MNLVNAKVYIGQTINPKQRWYRHKQNARYGIKHHLYESMRKHGIQQFEFEIIACCQSQEDCDFSEKILIDEYGSRNREKGYNKLEGGDRTGMKHNPETLKKMSESHLGQEPWNKGKPSPWTSARNKQMNGKSHFSDEEITKWQELRDQGMSTVKIAKSVGCNPKSVQKWTH